MIRIILLGRTGNHLFQYALGRVLSRRHGVPLIMDASWFNRQGWVEVSHFLHLPIQARVVRRCSLGARAMLKATGRHYWQLLPVPFLRESETHQHFDPRFLDAPADCVLFGYFQTPRYFESMANELRAEINSLLESTIHPPTVLAENLADPESVAVHVRRGDYLQIAEFQVCGPDYYQHSMDLLRGRLKNPHFHIFSDDPEWCANHFEQPDTSVIDSRGSGGNPLLDLRTMSLASHHIIANSTYSWWAAWLGRKTGQSVIVPSRWSALDNKVPIEEKLCDGWEILSA